MPAPLSMVSATRARGDVQCLHTGEPKIVQWTSLEVQQWTVSESIDGYRFERRQPGRTLPQLPRFGMRTADKSVALRDFKEYGSSHRRPVLGCYRCDRERGRLPPHPA